LLANILRPGIDLSDFTAEEKLALGTRLAQAICDAPDLKPDQLNVLTYQLDLLGLGVNAEQGVRLAEKILKFPTNDRDTKEHWWRRVQGVYVASPGAERVALLRGLAKDHPREFSFLRKELFQLATPADAKLLVRELLPQLTVKTVSLLRPLVLLAEQTDPADRAKFHDYLLTQMKAMSAAAASRPGDIDAPGHRFAQALAESPSLAPAVADELLTSVYADTAPRSGRIPRDVTARAKLLTRASPAVRQQRLATVVELLAQRDGKSDMSGALHLLAEISESLAVDEALSVRGAVIGSLAVSIENHSEPVALFLRARPATEQADGVILLAKQFAKTGAPADRGMKNFAPDPKGWLLIAAEGVPTEGQERVCSELVTLAKQASNFPDQLLLAQLALACAEGLTTEQRLSLATLLAKHLPQEAPADEATRRSLNVLPGHIARLLAKVPAEQSLPIYRSLLTACEPLVAKLPPLTDKRGVQEFLDPVGRHLAVLANHPSELPSAELAKFASLYVAWRSTGFSGVPAMRVENAALGMRGTLPAGEGVRLTEEALKKYAAGQPYDKQVIGEVSSSLRGSLKFVGGHLPAGDAERVTGLLMPLISSPDHSARSYLGEVLNEAARGLSPPAAEKFAAELTQVSGAAADQQSKMMLTFAKLALLRAIASSNPQKYVTELTAQPMPPEAQIFGLIQLDGAGQEKVAPLLLPKLGDAGKPQSLNKQAIEGATAPQRLRLADTFAAAGHGDAVSLMMFAMSNSRSETNHLAQVRALLREPDCVGWRRRIACNAPLPEDIMRPTPWFILLQ
jgi:hypothetical protein